MQSQRGCFITLEGLDGAGKSTHVQWLVEHISAQGIAVVCTREPGGTELGEQLRQMVLSQPMHLKTETLLMFAARCEHIATVIEPALQAGHWVVCDRFTDASYAYQGGGRELGSAAIASLEQWVHPGLQPDRTWLFDVPLSVARERLARSRDLDRFEKEGDAFFERTRKAYHERTAQCPQRLRIVDSTLPIESVRATMREQAQQLIDAWKSAGSAQP
ncbi:dTMP kinase [Eoetvoesiella caeni]|uniref:Thymidylate kinase n=1 Tax=Eoetvoesiella caeni TaxID=645616 RepID=A0A366HJ72_9BURK|nr:dTMP kinase [Eoetvoesiella caeni]MCI2807594.1 dTMP kinase [Eoetvoesiella caeni]NYT53011.1 dTMP kinase [Eoetvoesiella caeni]RBP42988.1 thymidylate kinase [Eoetvoesiella caeni]